MQQANLADSGSIPSCADYPSDSVIPLIWNITITAYGRLCLNRRLLKARNTTEPPRTCRDSSVTTATSTGRVFLFSEVPTEASNRQAPGFFSRWQSSRIVNITIHHHLVPRLNTRGAMPPLLKCLRILRLN